MRLVAGLLALLGVQLVLAAACGGREPTPVPTQATTAVVEVVVPTSTVTPVVEVVALAPTGTPAPTPTPAPAPTPAASPFPTDTHSPSPAADPTPQVSLSELFRPSSNLPESCSQLRTVPPPTEHDIEHDSLLRKIPPYPFITSDQEVIDVITEGMEIPDLDLASSLVSVMGSIYYGGEVFSAGEVGNRLSIFAYEFDSDEHTAQFATWYRSLISDDRDSDILSNGNVAVVVWRDVAYGEGRYGDAGIRRICFTDVRQQFGGVIGIPTAKPAPLPVAAGAWTRQFEAGVDDTAMHLAVDDSGSVYVLGVTDEGELFRSGTPGNLFIRKYDATGVELWTHQLGSQAWEWVLGPTGMDADGQGNVYVVGATERPLPGQPRSGGRDGFLRKYDSGGQEVWRRQFGSPADETMVTLQVDHQGNIYVAGNGIVGKYDADGTQLWIRQFGTGNNETAEALGLDIDGNAYVAAGQMFARYDGHGEEMWAVELPRPMFGPGRFASERFGSEVVVDGQGNAYFGAGLILRKYDSTGAAQWSRQFVCPSVDGIVGMAVDPEGNLYVAAASGEGYTGELPIFYGIKAEQTPPPGDYYIVVGKYTPDGQQLWLRRYASAGADVAVDALVDKAGSLYIAGMAMDALPGQADVGGESDTFVMKLVPSSAVETLQCDSLGVLSSETSAQSPTPTPSPPPTPTVAPTPVPGTTTAASAGDLLWSVQTGSGVRALAMTPDGSRVAAGSYNGKVYMLDAEGGLLWSVQIGGSGSAIMAMTPDGSRVAAGYRGGKVYLLNSLGELLWSFETGHLVSDVAMTPDGSRVIVGTVTQSSGPQPRVYMLDGEGELLWSLEIDSNYPHISQFVAMTPDGSRVAVGSAPNVYMLDAEGGLLWSFFAGSSVRAVAMTLDGSRVAAGSGNGTVNLLGGEGELLWSFEPGGNVRDVVMTPDGSRVAVGSYDNKVNILNGLGELLWSFDTGHGVVSLAMTPDGSQVAVGSEGKIYMLRGE